MKNSHRSWRARLLSLLVALLLLTAAYPALAQEGLVLVKDALMVRTFGSTAPGWRPVVEFTVKGAIPSGSQFWVDFGYPAKRQWLKFDCQDPEQVWGTENQWKVSCGDWRGDDGGKGNTLYTGIVDFGIHVRNPLMETDANLFKGKIKVVKEPKPADDEYYVDDDWRFPIGYVFFDPSDAYLTARVWFRGNLPTTSAHLFYQGKEIAKYTSSGMEASEWSNEIYQWQYMEIRFQGVYLTQEQAEQGNEPNFAVSKNPGEYEIKILMVRQLARTLKFTVLPDGTIDNSIATANKVGSDRVLVPVRVVGTLNQWNKLAWKTDAFYGNPLTGFTAPP